MVGTAIDYRSHVYVERSEDQEFLDNLEKGNHCNLHAGRQCGKTTLMNKAWQILLEKGHECIAVELTVLSAQENLLDCFSLLSQEIRYTIPEFYPWQVQPETIEQATDALLWELRKYAPKEKHIYLFIDELDILTRFPRAEIASFFSALRRFSNQQVRTQGGTKLVIGLVSVLTPNDFVVGYNLGGTNLNFGYDIFLKPFEKSQIVIDFLLQGVDIEKKEESYETFEKVLELTGGQPFLTLWMCQRLANHPEPECYFFELKDDLMKKPRSSAHRHFLGIEKQLLDNSVLIVPLLWKYKEILQGKHETANEISPYISLLENIGLIRQDENSYLQVANSIYEERFSFSWIDSLLAQYETLNLGKEIKTEKPGCIKKRLALIFTGGTIGMILEDGKAQFSGAQNSLHRFVKTELNELAEITTFSLYERDGINMTPKEWVEIANFIHNRIEEYDGFVVAHGTDTLAFTASAVAFMLGSGLSKPVVFTGAQTTIDILHGDTRNSLIRSCFVATHQQIIPEVAICFGDLLFRACRAQKTDDRRYDGFKSPAWPALARITEKLLVNEQAFLAKKDKEKQLDFRPWIAETILYINIVPGLKPDIYRKILEESQGTNSPIDGILLTTPGAGNIPSTNEYSFRPLIQSALEYQIPVLITSQVPINPFTSEQYEVASIPTQYGAIPGGNLTVAAALTKFSWVIGCVNHELSKGIKFSKLDMIKSRMKKNYIGEEGGFAEAFNR